MYCPWKLGHYLNSKAFTEWLDMVRDMKGDPILPLNGLFLHIGEEGADGTSLSFVLSGRQTVFCVSQMGIVCCLLLPCRQRKRRIAGMGSCFWFLGLLFLSPWNGVNLVVLRVATKLSGVIMGGVWGETTPVSELSCKLAAKAKQSPETETRISMAARGTKEETNIVLKTRKDHCDYLVWPLVLHRPQNMAQWLLQSVFWSVFN